MKNQAITSEKNKRIAKNTALLYMRMLLTMAITLYTSRIVLRQLGVNDFGIYNVVGGLVSMFAILSASLTSAISRFLTFELGKGNNEKLKKVFSASVMIQMLLALVIIVLVEVFGVWFLNNKMTIDPSRIYAANWVLQCSLITFAVNMLSVPYNAVIIAHERMQIFAYVSILEVSLKLGVAFLLFVPIFDTLILYAMLLLFTSIIIRFVYGIYCTRNFKECHLKKGYDRNLVREMLSYSGWNFIGSSSSILRDQGVNIVMNIFCGTAINAARGISVQVLHAVSGFSQNFMMAVNPQIIKSYAMGDFQYMINLAFRSSKLSYFLLLSLSLPLIMEMPGILSLWLTEVPDHSIMFARLMLVFGMSEAISLPLQYINQATGKIKIYQLVVGGLQALNFPISYILLKFGFSPDSVFVLAIIVSQIGLFARLWILHKSVELPVLKFLKEVYFKIAITTMFGVLILWILYQMSSVNLNIWSGCVISTIVAIISIYVIGCSSDERVFIKEKLNIIISKLDKNAQSKNR